MLTLMRPLYTTRPASHGTDYELVRTLEPDDAPQGIYLRNVDDQGAIGLGQNIRVIGHPEDQTATSLI